MVFDRCSKVKKKSPKIERLLSAFEAKLRIDNDPNSIHRRSQQKPYPMSASCEEVFHSFLSGRRNNNDDVRRLTSASRSCGGADRRAECTTPHEP